MDAFEYLAQRDRAALRHLLAARLDAARARNAEGASLLMVAAYRGDAEAVAIVRGMSGDIDPWEAIIMGDEPRVRAALADGWDANARAPDGFPPLALAVFFRHRALVDLLLPMTAAVNARAENAQRVAALHAAVTVADAGVVELLLSAGADPNLPQSRGLVALHSAAASGNAAITGLLLLFGADASVRDDTGLRAADYAAQRGHGWLAQRLH